MGNFNHTRATEGVQWVIRELAVADVASYPPGSVIGREAGKAHLLRLNKSNTRTESVFFTHGAGDNFLEVHFDGTEEVLRKIRAMEAHRLIGIRSVVVIPVKKCGWRLRSQPKSVHPENAADINFARARQQTVAHHAHDRTRNDAEVFLNRRPALHGADADLGCSHPLINHRAQ